RPEPGSNSPSRSRPPPEGTGHRSWVGRRTATGCPTTLIYLELLGDVPNHVPKDATVDAALAFEHHCSVFKEPRPDGRPARGRRRSSGEHPLRCREVWCGKRASVSTRSSRNTGSGERTHHPMGETLYRQTGLAPGSFPGRSPGANPDPGAATEVEEP